MVDAAAGLLATKLKRCGSDDTPVGIAVVPAACNAVAVGRGSTLCLPDRGALDQPYRMRLVAGPGTTAPQHTQPLRPCPSLRREAAVSPLTSV
jgi:hypothetical protein